MITWQALYPPINFTKLNNELFNNRDGSTYKFMNENIEQSVKFAWWIPPWRYQDLPDALDGLRELDLH